MSPCRYSLYFGSSPKTPFSWVCASVIMSAFLLAHWVALAVLHHPRFCSDAMTHVSLSCPSYPHPMPEHCGPHPPGPLALTWLGSPLHRTRSPTTPQR